MYFSRQPNLSFQGKNREFKNVLKYDLNLEHTATVVYSCVCTIYSVTKLLNRWNIPLGGTAPRAQHAVVAFCMNYTVHLYKWKFLLITKF